MKPKLDQGKRKVDFSNFLPNNLNISALFIWIEVHSKQFHIN